MFRMGTRDEPKEQAPDRDVKIYMGFGVIYCSTARLLLYEHFKNTSRLQKCVQTSLYVFRNGQALQTFKCGRGPCNARKSMALFYAELS